MDKFNDLGLNEGTLALVSAIQDEANLRIATIIYERHGPSFVYEYARKIGVKSYQRCEQCETETPNINRVCMLCGTFLPKI